MIRTGEAEHQQDGLVDDASANAGGKGVYANRSWTEVIGRPLVSTDAAPQSGEAAGATDADLNQTGSNPFSVAFTNRSGINHNEAAGPVRLTFDA